MGTTHEGGAASQTGACTFMSLMYWVMPGRGWPGRVSSSGISGLSWACSLSMICSMTDVSTHR